MLSHVELFVTLWAVVHQVPLSMVFSRLEYWSRLLFPPPGNLLDPRIEPTSPVLAGRFFTTEPPGKPILSFTTPLKPDLLRVLPISTHGNIILQVAQANDLNAFLYFSPKIPQPVCQQIALAFFYHESRICPLFHQLQCYLLV